MAGREGLRVTSLDFPGFGAEAEPPAPWGVEDYTRWLEARLTALRIADPVLVGHSFGGRVAIVYASRNRVDKMVLVDAAGVKPRRSARYYIKVWSFKIAKRFVTKRAVERWRARRASADYLAASAVMRGTLSRVVNEDLRRFMPLIGTPTLLVWGSRDTATPVGDARRMERLIPDAGLVIFEGAGHYSFIDHAAQFYTVFDKFVCG